MAGIIFADGEIHENAVIRKFLITAAYVYASSFTTRAARVRGRSTDFPVRAWTRSFISTV